jgi:hypothetical protein
LLDELDELDELNNSADENNMTNTSLTTFPDLNYILNQKPIPQKQFERFDPLFTPEKFLNSKVLINTRKNHDAFSRNSKNTLNKQALSETSEKISLLNNANRLITELTNNFDAQENHINRRKDRWEGRKRLATIPIAVGINGKYFFLFFIWCCNII